MVFFIKRVLLIYWLCIAPLVHAEDLDGVIQTATLHIVPQLKSENKKIIVVDPVSFDKKVTNLSLYISNKVGNLLIQEGVEIVDRKFLDRILEEQRFQASSLVSAQTAVKVGKLAGARFMVLGQYTSLVNKFNLSFRVLDVETGKYLIKAVGDITVTPVEAELSEEIEFLLSNLKPESLGSSHGFRNVKIIKSEYQRKTLEGKKTKFDSEVCNVIDENIDVGRIIVIGGELGFLDQDSIAFGIKANKAKENKWGLKISEECPTISVLNLGDWHFSFCNDLNESELKLALYSRRNTSSPIKAWLYQGNSILNSCITKTNTWQNSKQ